MSSPHILVAPVLRAEGWTSIDLQQQNILAALRARAKPPSLSVLQPPELPPVVPLAKQLVRDVCYPWIVRAKAAALGRCVLHVTDHSYGHLCAVHGPCVINCNDLHHHVRPELPAGQLRRWKRRVDGMRQADKILVMSAHLATEVQEHLGLPPDRVASLPGGVDSAVFRAFPLAEAAALLPRVAELRAHHFLVLNIGVNIPRKNLPTLLRALQVLLQGTSLPVKLLKAGPPLRGSEHEALIRELGIGEAIVDLGPLPPASVAAACRLAQALSFPSLYEGFGRPTLEAQACELPCVLADASCMREIGGSGALYHPPLDPEALADALRRVLTDESLRHRLIAAGRQNAARFSWTAYADRLMEIYAEIGH